MNIRDMIERLKEVAEELPDGLDSDVRVHLCNGLGADGVITREVTVATRRRQNQATLEVKEAHAVVQGHSHLDDGETTVSSMMNDVDDELARLTGETPQFEFPPGTKVIVVDTGDGTGYQLPLDDDGKIISPGSALGIQRGCVCDSAKNNDGLGIDHGDGRYFIFKDDCPLHGKTESSRDLWVIE